jgi:hypothetical protein
MESHRRAVPFFDVPGEGGVNAVLLGAVRAFDENLSVFERVVCLEILSGRPVALLHAAAGELAV